MSSDIEPAPAADSTSIEQPAVQVAERTTPTDPARLKVEIEKTRAELGHTVEALVAKFDVKSRSAEAFDRFTASTKEKIQEVRTKLTPSGHRGDRAGITVGPDGSEVVAIGPGPAVGAESGGRFRLAADRDTAADAALAVTALAGAAVAALMWRRRA
jgi:hypothetical protein